jgi:hypothetical protein
MSWWRYASGYRDLSSVQQQRTRRRGQSAEPRGVYRDWCGSWRVPSLHLCIGRLELQLGQVGPPCFASICTIGQIECGRWRPANVAVVVAVARGEWDNLGTATHTAFENKDEDKGRCGGGGRGSAARPLAIACDAYCPCPCPCPCAGCGAKYSEPLLNC